MVSIIIILLFSIFHDITIGVPGLVSRFVLFLSHFLC